MCIVRDSSQLLAFREAIDDFYETTAVLQEATGHFQVMTHDFSVTTRHFHTMTRDFHSPTGHFHLLTPISRVALRRYSAPTTPPIERRF